MSIDSGRLVSAGVDKWEQSSLVHICQSDRMSHVLDIVYNVDL